MLFNYSFCHTKGISCVLCCSYVWNSDVFYTKLKACTCVHTWTSDVDRLYSLRGEYSQFPTEIMNCKISHFLNFPLFGSIIIYFFILLPLDTAAWGGHTTRPPTHQRPPYRHTYWHVDTFQSTYSVEWNTVSSICLNSTQTDSPYYLSKTDNSTLFPV